MDVPALADTLGLFRGVIPWHPQGDLTPNEQAELSKNKQELLEKCRALLRAEIVGLYLVEDGCVRLESHVGYHKFDGSPIPIDVLSKELAYRLTSRNEWHKDAFDGIIGLVASRGVEVGAQSWDEIKEMPSYSGKADRLGVWDETERPFTGMFAVPIMLGSETIGVLKFENKVDGPSGTRFDPIDKEVTRTLAGLFSIAIGHDRLDRAERTSLDPGWEARPDVDFADLAERFDAAHMARVIEGTPAQVEFALSDPDFPSLEGMSFEKAVVLGLGGSALPVDVLNDAFAARLRSPVVIQRHYELPRTVDDQTLIVLSSFSGNTEETLYPLRALPENATNVVAMTAGGRLAEEAADRGYPVIRIPKEREVDSFQPRCATGYIVTYLARLLTGVGLLEKADSEFANLAAFLRTNDFRPDGEKTARWLAGRHPVFYTDHAHELSVGRIAKIKFNENAKRPAFFNALPEVNHNEMIGYSVPDGRSEAGFGRFGFLYLRDPDSLPSIHERYEVMVSVLEEKGLDHLQFAEWEMRGEDRLQRIFSALVYADWISYAAALLNGVDPTPVHLVESFKRALVEGRQIAGE